MNKKQAGFGDLVWVRDKDGAEYACPISAFKDGEANDKGLSPEVKANCINVNTIVGTERW